MDKREKVMRQQIEGRLDALKDEYSKGQTQLRQLESQVTSLRETLLRISGAMLVLEELLSSSLLVKSIEQPSESDNAHTQFQGQREGVTAQAPSSDGHR
jgi:hypothetical protein